MDRCTLATRLATDSCWLFNELEYSMNECIESKKKAVVTISEKRPR